MFCNNCIRLTYLNTKKKCMKCQSDVYINIAVLCDNCSASEGTCGICLKKNNMHSINKSRYTGGKCKSCGGQ